MKTVQAAMLFGLATLLLVNPCLAAGEILLTQAKAIQGGVTLGDTPGFPITLSTRGSYQFAGDITPPAGKVGIQITAPYVTIDLKGFLLHGGNAATNGIVGVGNAVTIRNGTIGHFKNLAILGNVNYWVVEDMTIVENGGIGVYLNQFGRILNSTISANGSVGIRCSDSCHVEGSVISSNLDDGIDFFGSGLALGNAIMYNKGVGIKAPIGPSSTVGFGNNTLVKNNGGGQNVNFSGNVVAMQPNICGSVVC